VMKFGVRKL